MLWSPEWLKNTYNRYDPSGSDISHCELQSDFVGTPCIPYYIRKSNNASHCIIPCHQKSEVFACTAFFGNTDRDTLRNKQ